MTAPKTYISEQPVDLGDEGYFKAGVPFTTAKPKGDTWELLDKAEKAAAEASQELRGDVPLEAQTIESLRALALTLKVNPKGLSKEDLITAIKAVDDPTR
jgi:hypothetical protein